MAEDGHAADAWRMPLTGELLNHSFSLGKWTTAQITVSPDGAARVANCCDSEPVDLDDLTALRDWLSERLKEHHVAA